MKDEVLVNYKSEGVEELLIRIVVDVVKSQKEGTIKDYDITYTDGETDYISISKKKDKYIVVVNGIKGELKRSDFEPFDPYKLILKIYEMLKLSEIEKIFS